MKEPVLLPEVLDGLRLLGDPRIPVTVRPVSHDVSKWQQGAQGNGGRPMEIDPRFTEAAALDANGYLEHVHRTYGVNPDRMIDRAQALFVRYGDEISAALLLRGLPESYAAEWGAPVLIAHGDLVWQLPRRIRQTALFLLGVLTAGEQRVTKPGPAPSDETRALRRGDVPQVVNQRSTLFQQCVWLRQFHASIRQDLGGQATAQPGDPRRNTPPSVPLNQEDLLATLLTFSVTTLRVLEAFGIDLDDADREAYVFLWNLVGACLGIGTPLVGQTLRDLALSAEPEPSPDGEPSTGVDAFVANFPEGWLFPDTVPKAHRLLDQMHARQWTAVQRNLNTGRPFPWTDLVAGRTLVTALLDGLVDAMPPSRQAWPAIVMRELVPVPVQARLGLQRVGLVGYAGTALNGWRRGKWVRRSAIRLMANDVTRHAMERFLQADGPAFRIEGLDLSQLTPVRRGSPYELRTR